jgi:hypothetical protein
VAELENLEEEVKLEKERLEIIRQRLQLEQEIAKKLGDSASEYIAALKEQQAITEEISNVLQKNEYTTEELNKAMEGLNKASQDELLAIKKKYETQIAALDIETQGAQIAELKKQQAKEIAETAEKQNKKAEFMLNTQGKINTAVQGMGSKLGLAASFQDTNIGKFSQMLGEAVATGNAGKMIGRSLESVFSPANLAVAFLEKVKESMVAVFIATEQANASFRRSTGFTGDFRGQMMSVANETIYAGVGIAEVGKAYGALAQNFSAFNPQAEEANKAMVKNVALLEQLGVSASESAKAIDFMQRSMGLSADAATDMTRRIAMAGKNIGITSSKMMADFGAVSGYLVTEGDRMEQVFIDLAAQAKATGIEVSSLVNLGKQFDSFSKAAEITGQLNAVLGTNLSTLSMINASTEDRLNLLRNEINTAVGGFDGLDKYTKMYVAQSLGLKDVGEAQRLLNMSQAEYAKYNKDMQARAATEKELADLTKDMVPLTQQLQIAITKLGLAFGPVISIFVEVLGFLADIMASIPDGLIQFLAGLALVVTLVSSAMAVGAIKTAIQTAAWYEAAIAAFTLNLETVSLSMGMLTLFGAMSILYGLFMLANEYGFKGFILGLAGAVIGVYALTVAFGSLNAAMGIIGVAFALISLALHKKNSPEFYLLFGVMAGLVVALALAFVFMQSVSMPVILALTALAFGLGAMFYAVSLLIDSMTGFFDLMLQNITLLPQLATSLYTLVPAFMALGGALMYAGLGFGTFAAGALAAALVLAGGSLVFLGAAVAMAPLVAEIFLLGEGFEKMGNGIEKISKALQLVSAITGGNEESFFALSSDGNQTSIVAAKGGMLKTFSSDKLTVDVKIPEIKVPQPIVQVYIDGREVTYAVKSMLGRDTGAG